METVLERTRDIDDPALLARFRAGDEAAFDAVMTAHRRAVYLMARRLLDSHEDADEASQQAFVRAWRAREGFRGEAGLRTWLIRIVLNVAKSMKGRVRVHEPLAEAPPVVDGGEPGDERLARSQLRGRVRRAVGQLPPRQREVVLLKVFSGLTHREVAGVMGLSEGAVKAHLHQAVSNLRRRMGGPAAGSPSTEVVR